MHRDIKPGNLFLSVDQTVRILDLGLAQDVGSEESLTRELNERVLGTADYLSPEQAADSHTVDNRADIYSLGCSLYFLLTGQPPYTEGTLVQRLIAHQTRTPPPVSEFRSDVPEELIGILLQMMARNRNDRTATAGDVAKRLSNFLAATSERPELNNPPAILQRVVSTENIETVHESEHTSSGHSEKSGGAETKTNSGGDSSPSRLLSGLSESAVVPATDRYLPEFAVLLKRIESDCDDEGSLRRDSRSIRLLALAKELRQLAEVAELTPGSSSIKAISPLKFKGPNQVIAAIIILTVVAAMTWYVFR